MNRLNELTNTLNIIEKYSRNIISKLIPIMKDLKDPQSDIVEEVLDNVNGAKKEIVLEMLQEICLKLAEDSEKIVIEIEAFSDAIIQGEEAIDEGEEEYPFLMEVWCGDIYEKDKMGALKELSLDLKDQLSEVDENKIAEQVINKLNKTSKK